MQRLILLHTGKKGGKFPLRQRQRRPLIRLGRRQTIKQARQQLAAIGNIQIHSAHTVHNAPPVVEQNQIRLSAHGLQHQGAAAQFTQFVPALQMQADYALHLRLRNFNQPGPGQMLAQQHAEHGRLRRILPQQPGELQPRLVGPGVEQQPLSPGQQHNDLIPGRLLDFINSRPHKCLAHFLRGSAQGRSVHWHIGFLLFPHSMRHIIIRFSPPAPAHPAHAGPHTPASAAPWHRAGHKGWYTPNPRE